jgi:SAM-dependent methyltransferase
MIDRGKQLMRVNVGCGRSPTAGWKNFDNSLTVRLAKIPLLIDCLAAARILDHAQRDFAAFVKSSEIQYADAARHIPLPSGTVDTLYSSHMLEHLYPESARTFLVEARRVLRSGGWLRLALPNLELLVEQYLAHRDADVFVQSSLLASPPCSGLIGRLRSLIAGDRHHLWMYDGRSLCKLLTTCGFVDAQALPPGVTRIPEAEPLNLAERVDESLYVEARNP